MFIERNQEMDEQIVKLMTYYPLLMGFDSFEEYSDWIEENCKTNVIEFFYKEVSKFNSWGELSFIMLGGADKCNHNYYDQTYIFEDDILYSLVYQYNHNFTQVLKIISSLKEFTAVCKYLSENKENSNNNPIKNPYYDLMKQICDEIHWFPKYGKHYTSTLEHYNQLLENNS